MRYVAALLLLLSGPALSADEPDCDPSSGLAMDASCLSRHIPALKTMKADPFQLCNALATRLPPRLPEIRRLAAIHEESVRPEFGEFCREPNECRIHKLAFTGLLLDLVVRQKTLEAGG